VEFVKATDLAVDLDNTQYLLCEELAKMKDEDKDMKEELKRIRLQIVLGISQLQNIVGTKKEYGKMDLDKELREWIKNLGELYKYAISLIGPKPRIGKGKTASNLQRS
jgi:hypothetical protein